MSSSSCNDSGTMLEMKSSFEDVSELQVLIKNFTGLTITLTCDASDTVANTKAKLYDDDRVKKELPEHIAEPSQLRLIFNGKQLEHGNAKLSDYTITKNGMVHLALRLRGDTIKKHTTKLRIAKAATAKTMLKSTPVSILAMEQATHSMVALSHAEIVNVYDILMSMDVSKLMEMKEYVNNHQAHIVKTLDNMYEFTQLGEQFTVEQRMLEESKERFSFLVKQRFMDMCETIGDLNDDIDKAITHKVSNSVSSVAPSAAPNAPVP